MEASPISKQLLGKLHENSSVQIIHYTDLWHPPRNVNPYKHGKVVLENFKRNFLLIGIIDGVAARDALLARVFGLTYRNPNAKVVFLLTEKAGMKSKILQGFIRKCFDWDLIDVVLIRNQDPPDMFTYDPFNNFQIVKLKEVKDFFPDRLKDLKNHPIKVLVDNMLPRVMTSNKGEQVIGYIGHLISSYIQKRNATVKFLSRTKGRSIYGDTLDYLVSRELEFLWGAIPWIHYGVGDVSYPFMYEKLCVIVPVPKAVPVHRNFIQPFQQDVWISIICGIFYITVMNYIVNAVVSRRADMSASFLTCLCFIIGRGEIGFFSHLNRRLLVIYLLLFLLGFILSNMYCALLTTFLTSPSYEPEIKTLADMSAAGLKIVGEYVEVAYLADRDRFKEYHPFLKKISLAEFAKIKDTLNDTYAILMPTDAFEFLNDIQRYRNDVKFQNSKICALEFYLAVLFKDESIYIDDFNDHVLRILQSGLMSYWKRNALFEALWSGYLQAKRGSEDSGLTQLTLIHLQVSFYVLVSGLAISTSAFLVEMLYSCIINIKRKIYEDTL